MVVSEGGVVLAIVVVTQRAATCLYRVDPVAKTFGWWGTYNGAGDNPFRVRVFASPADCQWTATPSAPWIELRYMSEPVRGTGDGWIYVSLPWNQTGSDWFGEVVVAGLSGLNPDARLAVAQSARH